ncbi:MAG: helix-turn-helix domain-containing protein [Rhodothermales bacterium]
MRLLTESQREARILDAAAELFIHFGYDKTTVADIAGQAGVSKGAIYLHYSSKDALFEALLIREMAAYAEAWLARCEADPAGGTIGGMYKSMLYALDRSPFMSALFKKDARVFGTYLRKPDTFMRRQQHQGAREEFVTLMQAAGAIRSDADPAITAHIMNMLSYGLIGMHDVMDAALIPPTGALIEGIADFMDRALTPADGGNSEAGKAIIRQMVAAGRAQLGASNPSGEPT